MTSYTVIKVYVLNKINSTLGVYIVEKQYYIIAIQIVYAYILLVEVVYMTNCNDCITKVPPLRTILWYNYSLVLPDDCML